MKIRTAIFVVYVAASALGMAVLMRFILAEVRPRYVTAVRVSMQSAVNAVARSLQNKSADEAAKSLAGASGYRVQLATRAGRMLYDSQEETGPAEGSYENFESRRSMAREVGTRLIDSDVQEHDLEVTAVAPVSLAGGETATLGFVRSFRSVNAVIWSERKKLAAIALVVSAVMLVAGWWIAARLTRSLERLTAYVQSVRDGRAVPPPRSRAQEVTALAVAFEEMRDALEGRQHAERYTQALAHEVKAPLAAIRGAAELLDEDMPREQRVKFMGNIRTESARIQQIVDRLLELSSIEARKSLQKIETLTGADLVKEAIEIMRPACAVRAVTLNMEMTELTVRGERVLLREALVNLLQNALEFSPNGGEVRVLSDRRDGRAVFAVEDRGAGVPDYAIGRVFERFYSLPRPVASRKSTGLGLALVREIACLHGGDASLENREGGGVRATFWLPLNRDA